MGGGRGEDWAYYTNVTIKLQFKSTVQIGSILWNQGISIIGMSY